MSRIEQKVCGESSNLVSEWCSNLLAPWKDASVLRSSFTFLKSYIQTREKTCVPGCSNIIYSSIRTRPMFAVRVLWIVPMYLMSLHWNFMKSLWGFRLHGSIQADQLKYVDAAQTRTARLSSSFYESMSFEGVAESVNIKHVICFSPKILLFYSKLFIF